jgi:hypothetical protein
MFPTLNSNSIFLYMSFTCVSGQMYVFPVTVALEVKYKNELLEKKRNDHELTLPLFAIHGIIVDPHGKIRLNSTSHNLGDFRG